MLQTEYLIVGLLGVIIMLLSKKRVEEEEDRKPNLILTHSPFDYSHLNYYPFYNPIGLKRHHRFHGRRLRHH